MAWVPFGSLACGTGDRNDFVGSTIGLVTLGMSANRNQQLDLLVMYVGVRVNLQVTVSPASASPSVQPL
jgi:hypothetical protein